MRNKISEGWSIKSINQVSYINPPTSLKKGTLAKYVGMENLDPFTRKISRFEEKEFGGGMKFINGDTLMARITPCLENGKTSYVDILSPNEVGFGSTEYIVFREMENKSDKLFLYYLISSPRFRDLAIHSMTGTSGRQRVQTDLLVNEKMLLPNLTTQKKIANILSSFDNKIELLKEQNKTLESIAQTIFKEWFVKFNFPGFTGKKIGSELGPIPEGWISGVLNDYIDELESGKRPKGGVGQLKSGIPSVGAESINGITQFDFSKTKYISVEFFNKMNTGKVRNYDILVYKDGGAPGTFLPRFTITGESFPFTKFAINEHVFRVRTKNENQLFFLYMWLNSFYCKRELQNIGSKAAIPGINSTDFRNISLLRPSEQILMAYHLAVSSSFKKILINNSQIENLSKARDMILPKLMRGDIKVKSDQKNI